MSFMLASAVGDELPRIVERPVAVGYAELAGAVLKTTAGAYVGAGTNASADITGVAIGPGGADTSGFNITARKEFPALVVQAVWPGPGILFSAEYVGSLGTIGAKYALVRSADAKYRVDFTDTDNDAVVYVGALLTGDPELQNRVLVTFDQAAVIDN
jgi:hypothetical protein